MCENETKDYSAVKPAKESVKHANVTNTNESIRNIFFKIVFCDEKKTCFYIIGFLKKKVSNFVLVFSP